MGIVLSIKASVARAICHPAIGRAIGQLLRDHIPYGGFLIETTSRNVCPETKAALFWGIYESCELRFVQRYIRRDLDVVELGASIGGVTCHIRKRLGPDQRLLAVEANPELAALACRSLERNGLTRNVSILNWAISYEGSASVRFALGDSTVTGRVADQASGDAVIDVPAATLSAILRDADIGPYALVSDIEGGEGGSTLGRPARPRGLPAANH